jgi:hypothetical protein
MKYENIITTATKVSRSWSNKEKVAFHYFNPNGLYAQKKSLDDAIWDLVEQGKAKSGAVIAYGSGNSYYPNYLRDLFSKDRISELDYHVLLQGYRFDIEAAENFIKEVA